MPDVKGLWQMVVVLLVLVVVVVPDRIGKVRGVGRVAVIVGELCCVVDIVGVGRYCYFGMVGVSNNEGVFEDFVAENMSATGSVDRNFVGGEGLNVGVGMKVGNSVVPGLGKIRNKFRIIRNIFCRILESRPQEISKKNFVFFGKKSKFDKKWSYQLVLSPDWAKSVINFE